MRLLFICRECGFAAPIPAKQWRLGVECVCGARIVGELKNIVLGLAVIAASFGYIIARTAAGGLPAGAMGWVLLPAVLAAMLVLAVTGFFFLRRVVPEVSPTNAILWTAVPYLAIPLCVDGLLAMIFKWPVSVGSDVIVSATLAVLAVATYTMVMRVTRQLRGRLAVIAALALVSVGGVLWEIASTSSLLPFRIDVSNGLSGRINLLLCLAFLAGCVMGYRTGIRYIAWARRASAQAGIDPDELQALIDTLCKDNGLRSQRFMVGRMFRIIRDSGLDVAGFRAKVQADASAMTATVATLSWSATCFFREPQLLSQVLSILRSADRPWTIKVLGASTGEEAYSVAILAAIAGVPSFRVLAGDISAENTEFARRATYNMTQFEMPADFLRGGSEDLPEVLDHRGRGPAKVKDDVVAKYFEEAGQGLLRVAQRIRDHVTLGVLNVVEEVGYQSVDMVFFRNVLPHLSAQAGETALRNISDHSEPHVVLILSLTDVGGLKPEVKATLNDLFEPATPAGEWPIFRKRVAKKS